MSYGNEDKYFVLWCLNYKYRFVNLAHIYFRVWFVPRAHCAGSEKTGRTDTEVESEGQINSKPVRTQMNL